MLRPRHTAHHLIEIVAVDLNEFTFAERLQRLGRIAREIAENADDEGQFLDHHCAFGFDFVFDVDAGLANPFQLFVYTCHFNLLDAPWHG